MSALVITGFGSLCFAGIGVEALGRALGQRHAWTPEMLGVGDALYPEPMPPTKSLALPDFDVRAHLGRKGTSFLDRYTGLALVACKQALDDSGLTIGPKNADRVGIALGTDVGSLKSTSDYSRQAQSPDGPHGVSPMLFPSTIMNFAASQAAIWFGLKGINATIAGGELAGLAAMRYAGSVIGRGYADVMLSGGVEECTPHAAWANHLSREPAATLPSGEGAAVLVLRRGDPSAMDHDDVDAEVLHIATGFCPGGEVAEGFANSLAALVGRALSRAGIAPSDVALVATGDGDDGAHGQAEARALALALTGGRYESVVVKQSLGACKAAAGTLQLAALLTLGRHDRVRRRRIALITNHTSAGGLGVGLFAVWGRDRTHHS